MGVFGYPWDADADKAFTRGSNTYRTNAQIDNTQNSPLYQTERWDPTMVEYRFKVPPGRYIVALKFAEIYFDQPGERVFDAAINGRTVLQDFDIVRDAGGP